MGLHPQLMAALAATVPGDDLDLAEGLRHLARMTHLVLLGSFENNDTATVAVSTDGGATFTTLRTFVNGEDDNNYHRYEFPLNSTSATTVVRFQGNMSARSDYYYVDDVEIRGVR